MKPCPFCGCTDIKYETYNFKESCKQDTSEGPCTCQQCGAKGGCVTVMHEYKQGTDVTPSYEAEAISLWNARYDGWQKFNGGTVPDGYELKLFVHKGLMIRKIKPKVNKENAK